jgi:hypothetical protein
MAQVLVLGAPDEGCAGKHGRSIPLADVHHLRVGQGNVVRIVDRASGAKPYPASYGWLFQDGTHLLRHSSPQLALCLAAEMNPI